MKTLYFTEQNLDIEKIKTTLYQDGVIAFPTETVYGLGALISSDIGIEKIYQLKKREKSKPLIVHIGKISDVEKVACDIPDQFYILANLFFPGPLTIILKKRKDVSSLISQDDTVAVRMPAHGLTLDILNNLDQPIVGTSANISNDKNPISAKDVSNTFLDKIDIIIDGGIAPIGMPSTIVSMEDNIKILRKGFISEEQIKEAIAEKIS